MGDPIQLLTSESRPLVDSRRIPSSEDDDARVEISHTFTRSPEVSRKDSPLRDFFSSDLQYTTSKEGAVYEGEGQRKEGRSTLPLARLIPSPFSQREGEVTNLSPCDQVFQGNVEMVEGSRKDLGYSCRKLYKSKRRKEVEVDFHP